MDEFRGKEVVCSGDGQCDSPGFSTKNLLLHYGSYFKIHLAGSNC